MMTTFLKWLLRFAIASIGLSVAFVLLVYFLLAGSMPDYSGSHEVQGITGPVEIVRDRYAVPHIFGSTDEDVFFGLGFAHAQDRLWQMTLFRRVAYGRLSELFGPETLETDRFMRILDIHGLSVDAFDAQDANTQSALVAYSRGVNAWISIVDNNAFNSGAPEFLIFDDTVRPWEAFDSIAILNLQAIELAGHADREALRARLAATDIGDKLNDLMPSDPGIGLALPFTRIANSESNSQRLVNNSYHDRFAGLKASFSRGASNVWAAAAERTVGGASLLASDPHLNFSAPSIWMLARLELSTGGVIGATIPGMPLVVAGRSNNLGWGITASYVDDQDIFLEQYAPETRRRYLTPEGSADINRRIEVIPIRGQLAEQFETSWTENGPVIPKQYFNLNGTLPRDWFLSLGWTLLSPRNTTMTASMRLMKAKTIDEALEAARLHRAPQLNLLVADSSEIAMQVVGAVPRRSVFHETFGTMPAAGWKQRNRWQGELSFDELPRFRNPQNGFLGNTNNKTVDRPYPDNLSSYWGDVMRFKRLVELFEQRETHTIDSFTSMQLDTQSYAAKILVPEFARSLWHTSETAAVDDATTIRNSALRLLFEWDGNMAENRPEPLIYGAWARAVQRLVVRDDLGSLTSEFASPDPVFLERVFQNIDGAAAWCDIVHTEETENCDEIALLALDEALSQLRVEYGIDTSVWRWGQAHQARHDHRVLGNSAIFSWLFSIRQSVAGGDHTLNMAKMAARGTDPYHSFKGAGFRGIYDFSDPDASLYVISTGQSGHPLSSHYDDQGRLWKIGGYTVMSLDATYARANAVGITVLEPTARR